MLISQMKQLETLIWLLMRFSEKLNEELTIVTLENPLRDSEIFGGEIS